TELATKPCEMGQLTLATACPQQVGLVETHQHTARPGRRRTPQSMRTGIGSHMPRTMEETMSPRLDEPRTPIAPSASTHEHSVADVTSEPSGTDPAGPHPQAPAPAGSPETHEPVPAAVFASDAPAVPADVAGSDAAVTYVAAVPHDTYDAGS